MTSILIYTKDYCPYCQKAKALLARKGQAFEEVDIGHHPARKPEMVEKAGGRTTVPQIFINGQHIGGCDDVHALDAAGKLDLLLTS